jgi:hypothetical protein
MKSVIESATEPHLIFVTEENTANLVVKTPHDESSAGASDVFSSCGEGDPETAAVFSPSTAPFSSRTLFCLSTPVPACGFVGSCCAETLSDRIKKRPPTIIAEVAPIKVGLKNEDFLGSASLFDLVNKVRICLLSRPRWFHQGRLSAGIFGAFWIRKAHCLLMHALEALKTPRWIEEYIGKESEKKNERKDEQRYARWY